MQTSKTRRQIAWLAAQLMYQRSETEYYRAKMKAARRVCQGWVKPKDLPSNAEIRDEIQKMSRMFEGESRSDNLREMRFLALDVMKILAKFRPRLIGSVWTGHTRAGSDIDIHVFSNSLQAVTGELDYHGFTYGIERKKVRKDGEEHVYRHIHISHEFPIELTVYNEDKVSFNFKSSITGKPIERAGIKQLEEFLANEYPDTTGDPLDGEQELGAERFQVYYSLLLPLEEIKQNPKYHPEGDALYHSLQVFDLACDELPYDEEFLLAALLHDVGKGIDRYDHVNSGLEALEGYITPRIAWLIEHHMKAHQIFDGTIGARQHRRLRENESYDELVLLGKCDRGGRQKGVETTSLEDALDYIRELAVQ